MEVAAPTQKPPEKSDNPEKPTDAVCRRQEMTVSYGSPLDAKEQVKQAIDIVDLVGSFIPLRRQGRNFVGLCPWHDDSRPSLQVNQERQSFKCWVCDIGGDIFSFIMKMEGVEFREALALLADRAGITLVKPAREPGPAAPDEPSDKRVLYKAMAWAERQYHECLLEAAEAEPARRYLQERGITLQSIERFQLGFAPLAWDWLLERAGRSPQRAHILETVGVLGRSPGGDLYDRCRGRVLFPIRDAQGRPVGIGGRLLPELGLSSPAKYLNSPETPLFAKSKLLYGLDVAREAIRKSHTTLVMEGYTDCIVAHQYGFTHAVAVLGTAVGETHIRILKRFGADRIVLLLDGDAAGQRRANEVLELFVAQQAGLQILTLPDDLDPCDFLQQRGAAALTELLATAAVDALEHAFRTATKGIDLEHDVHGATAALERLVAIVAKAPRLQSDTSGDARLREEKILQRFAALFRVDEAILRQRMTALRRRAQSRAPAAKAAGGGSRDEEAATAQDPADLWDRMLLEILIAHPEHWPLVRERMGSAQLSGRAARQVYETCCGLLDAAVTPAFERLMLECEESAAKNLLVDLDEHWRLKGPQAGDPMTVLENLLKAFQKKEVERQRRAQSQTLREKQLDTDQENELLLRIVQQQRAQQGISKPTDG
ncbi:MAG: DNA primase [Thermoguttaceae bacterium]|jgi:DNA primase